jgi:tRNA(Ile)-lysidine synthase
MAPDVSREAFVGALSLDGALEVRGPRPGDRVRPLGAPGTRKVQDILVDLRIPFARRPFQPLLVCDGRVVWVCGLLIAEEGRITRETTGIVRLSMGLAEREGAPDTTGTR